MRPSGIIALLLIFFTFSSLSAADPAEQLRKAKDKERKEVMKTFKKENWRVLDSSKSIETALLEHWAKMDKTVYGEIVGIASKGKNKNQLMTMAINNAMVVYSQSSTQKIKAFATALFSGNANNVNKELESFYNSYSRALSKEIHGELIKSFIAYRELNDGSLEVKAFYILDEEKAAESQRRTLENLSENEKDGSDISLTIIKAMNDQD